MSTATISDKATEKLVEEFHYLRAQAVGDFAKFFDYITYSYQIDNVVLLITGTLHERDTHELLERCHPLGWFNSLPALCVATTAEELYHSVLIETPLGSAFLLNLVLISAPYFKECLSATELDELNIEIIRNTLYKAYLEDFLSFCSKLPAPTNTIMQDILFFEADRRAINITVNSFGTDLSKDERAKLYPDMGRLYPNGTLALQRADDVEGVKLACDSVVEYRPFFEQTSQGGGQKSLEDHFFEREAQLNKLAFLQQV
jgi:V-type H+-transporting ATPase subunit d